MSDVQMTHSTDCWKWHHECAKRVVEELAIDKERLRADNERLKTLEAAVRDLVFDADECDCDGLGLHALHNAWSPVHKALDAIDAAMKASGSPD